MNMVDLLFGARPMRLISQAPRDAQWRNVRPRGDAPPVRAWVAEADRHVESSNGALKAKGGEDVIVAHGDDDHSVVKLDIFERTYEPLGGGLYRKRDDVVLRYFTLDRPALVATLEGKQRAEPGDWIMQGVSGALWPVPREKAVEKYQPA